MAKNESQQNLSFDFDDANEVAAGARTVLKKTDAKNGPSNGLVEGGNWDASESKKLMQTAAGLGAGCTNASKDSSELQEAGFESPIGLDLPSNGLIGSLAGTKGASEGFDRAAKAPSERAKVVQGGKAGLSHSGGDADRSRKMHKRATAGRNQAFEINPNVVVGETLFDIDTPKRRNVGYRVRRDLVQERQVDMPLFITGVEIRAGIAEDDRHWNRKFNDLREQIVREISDLRFVIGERMLVEVNWNLPLNWPYVALRAPDGRRIVETDSAELASYGLRSVTMLWKGIVEKQQAMQCMARNYAALLRWAEKLRTKVPVAMDGSRTCRLLLDPEINKQINELDWPTYLRDTSGGPFSPLPFNVYESMRVRLWAHVKAVKQHVHAMNLNYNRVTNESRLSLGKTRGAALAVSIVDGPARTPMHYWALWVRKGSENLFYRTVSPRVVSSQRGKYVTPESFAVSDERGRLATYAIDRCHLSHMKDLYRAADHVLTDLLALSQKTAELIVETMGKRHGNESSAASGRGSWRGSGVLFRWIPGQ